MDVFVVALVLVRLKITHDRDVSEGAVLVSGFRDHESRPEKGAVRGGRGGEGGGGGGGD